ncbi:MAG: desulfoferrodoxin [Planctomycetia bacterium]|nr:desulfoferrodoxin [Planctomycetia bacterium]
MTKVREIYVCSVCGNTVEVIAAGGGTLVCCGQPMNLQAENTQDASREKHVPVATRQEGKVHVVVGSVAHPMEANHYIEWIEFIQGNHVCRRQLHPGEAPEAVFCATDEPFTVRAFCNLHGLWSA